MAMTSDQIENSTIVYSPIANWSINLDWHYGFGQWIECSATPFNCTSPARISSAGAYGAYPFIDFNQQYFGIVAREGELGTAFQGYLIWLELEDSLGEWASQNR